MIASLKTMVTSNGEGWLASAGSLFPCPSQPGWRAQLPSALLIRLALLELFARTVTPFRLCACGCGEPVHGKARTCPPRRAANASCANVARWPRAPRFNSTWCCILKCLSKFRPFPRPKHEYKTNLSGHRQNLAGVSPHGAALDRHLGTAAVDPSVTAHLWHGAVDGGGFAAARKCSQSFAGWSYRRPALSSIRLKSGQKRTGRGKLAKKASPKKPSQMNPMLTSNGSGLF